MPIAVDVDHHNRLVMMTARDPMTRGDVIAALDTQAAAGGWGYRQVGDYSGCTWTPTVGDVDAFVAYINLLTGRHGQRGPDRAGRRRQPRHLRHGPDVLAQNRWSRQHPGVSHAR